MTYNIRFTDNTNNTPLTVNDNSDNRETSLVFPGRNKKGYGVDIAENFLHLLENFANSTEPTGKRKGQIWYDSSNKVLKVYDGSFWKLIGTEKGLDLPTSGNTGDLFVKTSTQQLFLFNGSTWILVGPSFGLGVNTGVMAEIIADTSEPAGEQIVLKTYVKNINTGKSEVVAIYSLGNTVDPGSLNKPFTPREGIPGFPTINPGLNLRTNTDGSTWKIWGISEKAESLVSNGISIPASDFLRSNVKNIVTNDFTIKSDDGVIIGSDSSGQLKLQVSGGAGVLSHGNSSLELKVIDNTAATPSLKTLLKLSTGTFAVGIDKANPTRKLDVNGTGAFSGKLEVLDTTDVDVTAPITESSNDSSSLIVYGGAVIKKQLRVKKDISTEGQLFLNYEGSVSNIYGNSAIVPVANITTDIGHNTKKFRNVYANTLYGNLEGNVTGNLDGNAASADRLNYVTELVLSGDVSSNTIEFDASGGTKTFETTISTNFILNQQETGTGQDTDFLLIYRKDVGLRKTAKDNFLADAALIPVGTILPYAGENPPTNYLFCDGSEKPIGTYKKLYDVIGYKYGDRNLLQGTASFRLPDLRGRFALGRNNMDNGDTILSKNNTGMIDTSTADISNNPVDRVMSESASNLAFTGGKSTADIGMGNLPLISVDTPVGAGSTSVKVDDAKDILPISVVNPYLVINYIIYAGKS